MLSNHCHQLACIALLLAITCSGCKLASLKPKSIWPMDVATSPQTPTKLAAIWSDTVLYTAGKPPTRGFGGRIYFYDAHSDAIKVDGKLIVYVYDDDNPQTDERGADKPARRFVISSEQLAGHYAGSELGPSYNVWIPWDAVGGPTRQLSLVPFFVPAEGSMVAGEHARHRLPGVESVSAVRDGRITNPSHARAQRPVAQIAYDAEIPAANNESSPPAAAMRTTTINIPGTTRDRLANSQPLPRDQRSYVSPRADLESRFDYYDRAKFSAARAAEYRNPRFTHQRTAQWERSGERSEERQADQYQEPQSPAPAAMPPASAEAAQESGAQWAERFLERQRQSQPGRMDRGQLPLTTSGQPAVHYGPATPQVPAGQSVQSFVGRAP